MRRHLILVVGPLIKMLGRFYSILVSLFIIPFLIGGIIGGFNLSLRIQQADIFGLLSAAPWALMLMNVGIAVIGIYIGGILGYTFYYSCQLHFFHANKLKFFRLSFYSLSPANKICSELHFRLLAISSWLLRASCGVGPNYAIKGTAV